MLETNNIQFKEILTPDLDIEKSVIAILNSPECGLIYIGGT